MLNFKQKAKLTPEEEEAIELQPKAFDCMFKSEEELPTAITLCVRDSFVKKQVDHYSTELKKKTEAVEQVILKNYNSWAEVGTVDKVLEDVAEALKQKITAKVHLKNDNQPNAKDMISDVKEKMLEMEDIDKDEYIEKARIMKAKQIEQPNEGDADLTPIIPIFEVNQVMKIKRKHLVFDDLVWKDENDQTLPEIKNTAEYQMPEIILKKGVRAQWDKAEKKLMSKCYKTELQTQINEDHMVKNFEIKANSNLERIANEQVIHMRNKLIDQALLDEIESLYDKLYSGLKCSLLSQQDSLLKDFPIKMFDFGAVKIEVKDLDYLTNLDANQPMNWFDVKYKINNEAEIKAADQMTDLCSAADDGPNSINQIDNIQCGKLAPEAVP